MATDSDSSSSIYVEMTLFEADDEFEEFEAVEEKLERWFADSEENKEAMQPWDDDWDDDDLHDDFFSLKLRMELESNSEKK